MTKYKKTGKCIWCGKEEPEVSFNTVPHILPRALGGPEVGFDVCDECNHYLGLLQKGSTEFLVWTMHLKRYSGHFVCFTKN